MFTTAMLIGMAYLGSFHEWQAWWQMEASSGGLSLNCAHSFFKTLQCNVFSLLSISYSILVRFVCFVFEQLTSELSLCSIITTTFYRKKSVSTMGKWKKRKAKSNGDETSQGDSYKANDNKMVYKFAPMTSDRSVRYATFDKVKERIVLHVQKPI